jgi:hypothetical protein
MGATSDVYHRQLGNKQLGYKVCFLSNPDKCAFRDSALPKRRRTVDQSSWLRFDEICFIVRTTDEAIWLKPNERLLFL